MAAAVPVIGQMAGYALGGPIGGMIGGMLGSALVAKPISGPRLADLRVQSASYNKPIVEIFNAYRVAGNIIWARNIEEQSSSGSGKGGPSVTTYNYFGTCAIQLCAGEITGVRRMWADGTLIYDASNGNAVNVSKAMGFPWMRDGSGNQATFFAQTPNGSVALPNFVNGSGALNDYFTLYLGTEDQLPDPTIQSYEGVDNTPAYRGTAYLVMKHYPLAKHGNRIPNIEVEVLRYLPNGAVGAQTVPVVPGALHAPINASEGSIAFADGLQSGVPTPVEWELVKGMRFNMPNMDDSGFGNKGSYLSDIFTDNQAFMDAIFEAWVPYMKKFNIDYLPRNKWYFSVDLSEVKAFTGYYTVKVGYSSDTSKKLENIRLYVSSCPDGYVLSADGSTCARLDYQPYTVGDIFSEVSELVGVSPDLLDVSAATDVPQGFILASRQAARQHLESLGTVFAYDVIECDNILKLQKRKNAPYAGVVAYEDLSFQSSGAGYLPPVQVTRAQDFELPSAIEVTYSDPTLLYRDSVARSRKQVGNSNGIESVTLPVVMNPAFAQALADTMLAQRWYGRTTYSFQLGVKWAHVNPGDVVDIPVNDTMARVFITKITLSPQGLLKCEGFQFDYGIYDNLDVSPIADVPSQPVRVQANPRGVFLDIPLYQDGDDGSGFYLAVYPGQNSDFKASTLLVADSSGNYSVVQPINSASTVGSATNLLPSTNLPQLWDEGNALTIWLLNGEVYSATEGDVLNGANIAVLGDEIIQFQNVTHNADGTVTLSRLLRGRRGTEYAMNTHRAGDRFVLLDSNVLRVKTAVETTGMQFNYKLVASGMTIDSAGLYQFTNNNVGLKPLSPVHVALKQRSSDSLQVGWIRRTRVGGEWRSLVDASLGEQSENYTVRVKTVDGVQMGQYSTTSPAFTYTSQQAATDFAGAVPASFVLAVAQVSSAVGPGTYTPITVSFQ